VARVAERRGVMVGLGPVELRQHLDPIGDDGERDAAKSVWLTEIGYPSNTTSVAGIAGPTTQADEVSQVAAFAAATSWIGGVWWYQYKAGGRTRRTSRIGSASPVQAERRSLPTPRWRRTDEQSHDAGVGFHGLVRLTPYLVEVSVWSWST
jgi:hypothetical protein